MILFLLISSFISAVFIIKLWQKKDGQIKQKLFWSFVLLIPLFGWLAYGSMYNSLEPIKGKRKLKENIDVQSASLGNAIQKLISRLV